MHLVSPIGAFQSERQMLPVLAVRGFCGRLSMKAIGPAVSIDAVIAVYAILAAFAVSI
jgi:hypothetical protein